MARKDDILQSFLKHELFKSKYGIEPADVPFTVREALNSENALIKTIALIVEGLERSPSATDNELRNSVIQFLNTAI